MGDGPQPRPRCGGGVPLRLLRQSSDEATELLGVAPARDAARVQVQRGQVLCDGGRQGVHAPPAFKGKKPPGMRVYISLLSTIQYGRPYSLTQMASQKAII